MTFLQLLGSQCRTEVGISLAYELDGALGNPGASWLLLVRPRLRETRPDGPSS